jgi:hypothetical protein
LDASGGSVLGNVIEFAPLRQFNRSAAFVVKDT